MKLSVRILTLLLCLSMLAGICSFGVSAAPATLTGAVKTDSAPIKIDGKETGATLTQYLLEKGSTYSTAADGLVSVVELELSDKLTMAVLNGGAYTWTKDTMGNNAVAYNKTHSDGTVIAATAIPGSSTTPTMTVTARRPQAPPSSTSVSPAAP